MTKALLVIDLQTAMFDGKFLKPIYKADRLIENAKSVLARARAANISVIYVQHNEPEGPFAPNTAGWEIHADIAPLSADPVVQKSRADAFQKTDLRAHLKRLTAQQLFIMGAQTEYCIDTNCRAAAALDYDVTLISDSHSTWDNDVLSAEQIIAHHNATLRGFAKLCTAADIQF